MRVRIFLLTFAVAAIFLSACTLVIDPSQMETALVTEPSPTPLVMEIAADVPRISVDEAKQHFDNGTALFVDSRSMSDYDAAHIAGALPVLSVSPYAETSELVDSEMEGKELIITYCT
jgi:hypothetical protein